VIIGEIHPRAEFPLPDPRFLDAGELGLALRIDGPLRVITVSYGPRLEPVMHKDGHLAVGSCSRDRSSSCSTRPPSSSRQVISS
jgi:hypothetical protein